MDPLKSHFIGLDQYTLADKARRLHRNVFASARARVELDAVDDTATLIAHLADLGVQPLVHPMVDDGGVVSMLIYSPRPRDARRPRTEPTTQIWACARNNRIWLRRRDNDQPPIDDDHPFTDLSDLGRVLDHGPTPRRRPAAELAVDYLTKASATHGLTGLRLAIVGAGWAALSLRPAARPR